MRDGQTEQVKITTGMAAEDKIEVVKGLQDGDIIILPQAKASTGGGGMGGASMFRQNPTR